MAGISNALVAAGLAYLPCLVCPPGLASTAPARDPAQEQDGAAREDPTDDELRSAWKELAAEDRAEIAAWFSAEANALPTLQQRLIDGVLKALERDPFDWPEAERPPIFDPEVHAPAQPIRRRWLSERSRTYKRFHEKVFRKVPERRVALAWTYDHGSREVRRVAQHADPERLFANGLAGCPPRLDLAEAVVERALDDGAQQKTLAALGHAYADRRGRAYPTITLYDVWGSGIEMEMPDVECLGIVHTVLDDWRTWVAPIRASQHDALYERIGELFQQARAHRALRSALARTFLSAEPALGEGYAGHLERLHALWARDGSDPATLAARLPRAEDVDLWLEREGKAMDTDGEAYEAGLRRLAAMAADSARVRATLVMVMREYGALEDR